MLKAAVALVLSIMAGMVTVRAQAPSHVGKTSPFIDNNINGFWEYLPRNYAKDVNQYYPLLIFFHGYGDSGAGSDTAILNKVLNAGTPRIIKDGKFPDSFYVAGKWHKFIVISPQIIDGFDGETRSSNVNPATIDALINYANRTYRIDQTRIYLCGLSMGGGIAWDYPGSSEAAGNKVAAVAVAAAATDLDTAQTDNLAEAFVPVLATHNTVDNLILALRTSDNIEKVQKSKKKVKEKNKPNKPPVDPDPLAFYWDTPGAGGELGDNHNAWSRTFEDLLPGITLGGNLRDELGYNVYEWMLQYARSTASPLSVKFESFTVNETENNVLLQWTTSQEQNVKSYIVEKSKDSNQWSAIETLLPLQGNGLIKEYSCVDKEPFSGINFYRIKEVDIDGRATYSMVKKLTINSFTAKIKIFPNPFASQLSFDFSDVTSASAIIVKLIDAKGVVLRTEKHILQPANSIISLQNLQTLANGFYYITVSNEEGKILGKEKLVKR